MDLDDVVKNMSEIPLRAMFDAYIPGDDPPVDLLERVHLMGAWTADPDARLTRSSSDTRECSALRSGAESHLSKWRIIMGIREIANSVTEVASKLGPSAPRLVTHEMASRSVEYETDRSNSARKRPILPAGGVFLNAEHTTPDVLLDKDEEASKLGITEIRNARKKCVGHSSWSDLVIPIEVTVDGHDCAFAFEDQRVHYLHRTRSGAMALERALQHMGQLFARHHRTHIYSLYLFRRQARILYCDRGGTLVSEPFTYGARDNSTLPTFFWRIARMSREQLGFDATVVPASPHDVRAMLAYAHLAPTDYIEKQIYHALSVNPTLPEASSLSRPCQWPPYQLTLCGKRYIIARPLFAGPGLHGRCTRGFLAYDVDDKAVRFMKDSWRLDLDRVRPEHEVYERLNAAGVGYVLTCLGHEDVRRSDGSWQITSSHTVVNPSRSRVFGHYRLLIKEVCRPLTDLSNFKEFTMIMCDALIAHREAWENAGILHHDVSVNNILIYEDGRERVERIGMLCDWDLCKDRKQVELDQTRGTPDPTGTWLFRSALSLQFPKRPYELSDDIESFIHVYHYCVLRFHETNIWDLTSHVEFTYNAVRVRESDGAHIGGTSKLKLMRSSDPPMVVFNNPTLNHLLVDIATLCSQHYSTIDVDRLRQIYDPPLERPVDFEEEAETCYARFVKRPRSEDSPEVESTQPFATQSSVAAKPLLRDHEALFDLFVRYVSGVKDKTGKVIRWPKTSTKCKDLFEGTRVAPRKNNNFSSSYPSREYGYSQDEDERPAKKRKGSDGSPLPGLEESREEEEEEVERSLRLDDPQSDSGDSVEGAPPVGNGAPPDFGLDWDWFVSAL